MDRNGRDARLGLVARRQAGTFSWQQAIQVGFPSSTISDRLRRGTWEKRLPGVYAITGTERTRTHELWVAVLAVGPPGALTHETSCLIHGAEALPAHPIKLTVPHRWHHDIPGIFVHQIDDLQPWHLASWRGLPVSRPARAVVELAATQPAAVIGRVADDLIASKRTTLAQITRVFAEVARPGKPGMSKVASVLDARGDGYIPPASQLERLLFDVLAAGGLAAPQRQVPLAGRNGIIGVVDAAYPDARLVLEADGRRWHDRVEAAAVDRRRDAEAARVGWQTLRFVHEQLQGDPAEVCAVVRDTRDLRLDLLRRAS
ncbi:MAG TPA: type IV toxin-antitoxin system AbiEi family antitoxin domain-containing protein [Acidimicrobiales bacterium]|nr:type IV toxin-antitoxin system AbiEi family antitoxin domain-containing protein [Acidimicrobiales bacterium]